MKHDLPGLPRLALTAAVVVALGAGVTTAAVIIGAADGDSPPRGTVGADGISLVAYDSCDTALSELKRQLLPHVGPYGLDFGGYGSGDVFDLPVEADGGAGRAAEAAPMADDQAQSVEPPKKAPEHSTTNVHEQGVDEPDLVKTDGTRIVSVADGVLRVVDVASRTQTAVVTLENGPASQLLLFGDRALVMTAAPMHYATPEIAPGEPAPRVAPTDAPTDAPTEKPVETPTETPTEAPVETPVETPADTPIEAPPGTGPVHEPPTGYGSQVALVDLTGTGKVLGTLAVDGSYLDARQVGSVARVVVRSAPRMEFGYPHEDGTSTTALLRNRDVVASSTIEDWLPRYELRAGGATTTGHTACADVSHPHDYTASSMLTVFTVDLRRDLGTGDPVTIVADGDTVYGTGTSLYVADDHSQHGDMVERGGGTRTELYQFDIAQPGKPVYVASGAADGMLLNQYSLSEFGGHLRVATTAADEQATQSMITVLARRGDELVRVGHVGGLGVGERIYSVRYLGATAYVVTFRETDPLYTVDLSDPAAPKVTGELKITGYSAYLHPAGENRLIGVGQEADQNGRVTGAQVSLFDTANPAAQRLTQFHLPHAWTDLQYDPHAFLYWPDTKLLVMPITGGDPNGAPLGGALVLRLGDDAIEQVGMLSHVSERFGDSPLPPRRAMVIGTELWTVSEAGMLVSDLDSLTQLAWLPFS